MATVKHQFGPMDAVPPATNPATLEHIAGTAFVVPSLEFDAATEETVFFYFQAANYGSGNITANILWYADTATGGDVVWGAALAAITPNTDSQDIETKAFATAQTVTDSHLATVGQRLHTVALTISNLDSIAADDWVCIKVYRVAADAADTMTGDAALVGLQLSYSDT